MTFALEKLLDGPVMHGGSQFLGREDGACSIIPTRTSNGILA